MRARCHRPCRCHVGANEPAGGSNFYYRGLCLSSSRLAAARAAAVFSVVLPPRWFLTYCPLLTCSGSPFIHTSSGAAHGGGSLRWTRAGGGSGPIQAVLRTGAPRGPALVMAAVARVCRRSTAPARSLASSPLQYLRIAPARCLHSTTAGAGERMDAAQPRISYSRLGLSARRHEPT